MSSPCRGQVCQVEPLVPGGTGAADKTYKSRPVSQPAARYPLSPHAPDSPAPAAESALAIPRDTKQNQKHQTFQPLSPRRALLFSQNPWNRARCPALEKCPVNAPSPQAPCFGRKKEKIGRSRSTLGCAQFAKGALGEHRRHDPDGIRLEIAAPSCWSSMQRGPDLKLWVVYPSSNFAPACDRPHNS